MSDAKRMHLEESERQMALAQLCAECGDSIGYHLALAAAHRATSKALRAGRG